MSERQALNIMMVGTNGTGKSTTMVKMLDINERNLIFPATVRDKAWLKYPKIRPKFEWKEDENPRKKTMHKHWYIPGIKTFKGTKVVDMSVAKSYKDAHEIFNSAIDERHGFENGGLFIDDQKKYIHTKGSVPWQVRDLFINRRHRMIDIFMASHSFQDVNADLISWEPIFFVHRITRAMSDTVKQKIANFDELKAMMQRVNKIADTKKEPDCYYFEKFNPIES